MNPFSDKCVVELAARSVVDAVKALRSVGERDLFRAVRPQGEGSFTCLLFKDYGVQSWIVADRDLAKSESMRRLDARLATSEGILRLDLGEAFVSMRLGARDWIASYVASNLDLLTLDSSDVELRATSYFENVSDILDRGTIALKATTILASLRLPPEIERVELPDGTRIRRFSAQEIEDLSRFDASMEGGLSINELSNAVAVECDVECRVELVEKQDHGRSFASIHLDHRHRVERFLDAMSIVLSHRCDAIQTSWQAEIKGLPIGLGRQSRLGVMALGLTDLSESQIKQVVATYALLPGLKTGHIGVASSRLTSAERRLDAADRLLDAVIGLEALLAPRAAGELSFRLALNYSLLGCVDERRERYEKMSAVLEVRNMLVHGATMTSNREQSRLSEAASIACTLLREALQAICRLSAENGVPKLDKEYWLTQLLGSKTALDFSSPP